MNEPNLNRLLEDLHTTLGLGVHLYDKDCHGIINILNESGFCSQIQTVSKTVSACRAFDDVCFRTAAQTQDVFAGICPFGFYTAVCPIYSGKRILGYLMVSRAILDTPEAEKHSLQAGLHCMPGSREKLSELLGRFLRKSQKELDAIPSILRSVCQYIEKHNLFPENKLTLGELIQFYVQRNLQQKLSLQDISEHLHYSKSTLTAAFRQEFDTTIVAYINQQRLEKAQLLLTETELSVGTIAQECGYSGAEYFSCLFKKEYGCSPISYRQAHKKAEA